MAEDGVWSCDDQKSVKSNGILLRQQCRQKQREEEERKCPSRRRMNMRKITTTLLIVVASILCSWIDENRNPQSHAEGRRRGRPLMVTVASFAPPLSPRMHPLSRENNYSSKKPWTGPFQMTSSVTTAVNTTAPIKGLPTTGVSLETKASASKTMVAPLKKAPLRISGGKNFIPPEKLDELLDKVDIVSLIESYGLPGFQRTSPYRATCLCPFHDDKNPSLQINGERGIYKCFSCGAGGNALKFVREYSKKYSGEANDESADPTAQSSKPLTFVEAVRVLEDSASTTPMEGVVPRRQWSGTAGSSSTTTSQQSRSKKKSSRQTVGLTPRKRILYANLFAAAYFEESLFGIASAGSARTHLRSRGIHPTTVKAFAIGFAPETYFLGGGTPTQQQQQRSWGEGSLVNRLRDEGFTPQEILDAGLAIVTRKGKEQQKQQQLQQKLQNDSHNETSTEDDGTEPQYEHKDFSTLMDRFRGRLVVPIFDATGTHVLGFGGRILETSDDANQDFKAAKYLNSPESLVFSKKELLFGQHMVKFGKDVVGSVATASSKAATAVVTQRRPRSLIIVEGYMDAIALWQAGVQETVASMGTALTKEQLLAAAKKARDIGGRVVLCLDNDAAGVAAVKRLCSGPEPILLSVMEESNIEIFVAELPESVKDPAEFLEKNQETEEALDEKFRAEVIDDAQEWTRWYMNSLIVEQDSAASNATTGEDGEFGQIFDSLASFLSVFESVDERMKKAAIIAPKLADLIDTDKENNADGDLNRTDVSSTTRIQLASDLVEKAANIAHLKSMNAQRNFKLTSRTEAIVPKSLEIGKDMSLEEGSKRHQKKSLQTPPHLEYSPSEDSSSRWRKEPEDRSSGWQQEPSPRRQRERMKSQNNVKRQNSVKRFRNSMTKHIGGVSATPFDDEWLGVTIDKYTNERNPLRYDQHPSSKFANQRYYGPESIIRFNKNEYHGTWTTPNAMAAGYVAQSDSKSLDFLQRGTSSLIETDGEDQSLFVEDLLFTILARFSEARQSLYESIRISEASGSGSDVQWSTPEREWLFKCLVMQIDEIPPAIVGQEDLSEMRSYLSNRSDAFPGALSSTVTIASEADSKVESVDEVKESSTPLPIMDVAVDTVEISPDTEKLQIVKKVPNYEGDLEFSDEPNLDLSNKLSTNSIPKIPAIGEEWSDIGREEGFDMADGMPDFGGDFGGYDEPMSFGDIDDMFMDSVGPIMEHFDPTDSREQMDNLVLFNTSTAEGFEGNISLGDSKIIGETEIVDETDKSEFLDATLVVPQVEEGIVSQGEGSLDRFFMEGTEICNIFNKYYADEDTMSLGSNGDKANWAVQDLYTILQFTSVLNRVDSGRKYMRENREDWFNEKSVENIGSEEDGALSHNIESPTADGDASAISASQNCELAKYCSSQDSDLGLRSDLRRLRNLAEKNKQSTERILAMVDADFTDRSADIRGYSWLGNVLKFNEVKALQWNDIIESKENFLHSHEGLDDLEDIVYSDWNELSDPSEMWEFDKNVDTNHRSHFADLALDRPGSESPDEFAERYEAEWDVESWEHDYDRDQAQDDEVLGDRTHQQENEGDAFPEDFSGEYEEEWGDHDI